VLRNPSIPQLNLGPESDRLYKCFKPYTDYRNGDLSANFPDAAQIWIANWKAQTGHQLDGAIAVDPIALSYLLKVTGPVTLPNGEKITADNVVPITLSTSYVRFASNNDARKAQTSHHDGPTIQTKDRTPVIRAASLPHARRLRPPRAYRDCR